MLKPFRVLEPTTVAEAATELGQFGDEAKVYAGGAELVLLLRHGLIQARALVNIKGIRALNDIDWDGKKVRIGATVTHHRLETDALVRERLPLLAHAESHVGNIRVRCQGTLGGNLCFADPHADPGTVLSAYDAAVRVAGKSGERELPMKDFLLGMYETALGPDEILMDVGVTPIPQGWRWSYQRIERFYRPTLNIAAVGEAKGEKIETVRLAVGCVGMKAERLTELEEKIAGLNLQEALKIIRESGSYLSDRLQPVDDLLGSAEYKLYITGVLLGRAVEEVIQGNGGNHGR
jgi:carbon-monoxide dehydrogenase medium subunit